MARAFSGGGRSSLEPSLTPESARGAPAWPARSSGRPGAPSQGQGFAAHPGAVALHGRGMEAGPPFQVRPGAASAPPAEPAFGAGDVQPAPGADGTTVRASQPPDLARREQGEDGGGTPPKRRAGRPARGPRRTDRIQRGPRRSRALSGPPWSASGGWGSGRVVLPVELEGLQGRARSPPPEHKPDRDHAAEPAPAQARRAPARPGRGPNKGRGAPCAQATTSTNAANCGDPNRGGAALPGRRAST